MFGTMVKKVGLSNNETNKTSCGEFVTRGKAWLKLAA
jgi:hypothetical protein